MIVPPNTELSPNRRLWVLAAAFASLVFDGFELGLMPLVSLSVTEHFLGSSATASAGGLWFARYTAALMAGAAIGGIYLGNLGDRVGRARAMGVSVIFYSLFAALGAFVRSQEDLLVLRFLVGLGVGGVWPNAVALVAECWPAASRPFVAGLAGVGINSGILLLSQIGRLWAVTADSWRWLFKLSGAPLLLGVAILVLLPESPKWLAARFARVTSAARTTDAPALGALLRPPLLGRTVIGVLLGLIPLVGAWAVSKWMIPWADAVGGSTRPGYKAVAQGTWAVGAALGSFLGAPLAHVLGRRRAYFFISLAATSTTACLFLFTKPLETTFLPMVFAQGLASTLYFGWLPLYLPELFPLHVRATGSGIAYNVGRFATAGGVFATGAMFEAFGGSYSRLGATSSVLYGLGLVVVLFAPDTTRDPQNR